MSTLLSRILLALIMPPGAFVFFMVCAFLFIEGMDFDEDFGLTLSVLLTAACMMGYWMLLWYKVVCWTDRRIVATIAVTGMALLVGSIVGVLISQAVFEASIGWILGSAAGMCAWLAGTVFVWRETALERAERIKAAGMDTLVCPSCGYNMTGLSEARCPECGNRYTLDQLLASQPETQSIEEQAGQAAS